MLTTICIAENRVECEPGIRLLIASLAHYAPECHIVLVFPNSTPDFAAWIEKFPQVGWNAISAPLDWIGFNIKPTILLNLLDSGFDDVIWVDSDILITSAPAQLFARTEESELIICEEAMIASHYTFDEIRTRSWQLPVGRSLPFALNTCILGVTKYHQSLLQDWYELLHDPRYICAQKMHVTNRPIHLMGDQEVLTALLASAKYAEVPLKIIRRGKHIIQYLGTVGYTVRERLLHVLKGPPVLVHSQGYKAWFQLSEARTGYDKLLNLYKLLSPYRIMAKYYRAELADDSWLMQSSTVARLFQALGLGHPALVGLPIALLVDLSRFFRRRAAPIFLDDT